MLFAANALRWLGNGAPKRALRKSGWRVQESASSSDTWARRALMASATLGFAPWPLQYFRSASYPGDFLADNGQETLSIFLCVHHDHPILFSSIMAMQSLNHWFEFSPDSPSQSG